MEKINKTIKKIGFTDKYLVWASVVLGLFIFACLAVYTFFDKDPIAYMLSAVGLLGTTIGFVVNKNKHENQAKITTLQDYDELQSLK